MAGKVRTAADIFYSVEDVQTMLGYSKSKSYKVIAEMNRELRDAGYCTCSGKVNRVYFDARFGIPAEGKRPRT